MKINYICMLSAAGIMALAATACRKEKTDNSREEASELYRNICKTTTAYIDSINNAPDSASVYALLARYDERMDEINYEADPDTDYKLNGGENDTIFQAMVALGDAHRNRLRQLAAHRAAAVDSIAADSMK